MERLQKVMAHAGVASRRESEKLIAAGRVKVNGEVVRELGYKVSNNDRIEVDQVPIYKEEPVYYVFYKPIGVISAVKDDKDRKVVTDFFPGIEQRIYPVGRLDYNTSGLLLLTNDGEFANTLMHPRYEINKVYVAKVEGVITGEERKQLERGVEIDGVKTAPAQAKILSVDKDKKTTIIELVIHEGRNRQVRKMLEAVGHPVTKLKRERYGFLDLKGLKPGDSRTLLKHEIEELLANAKKK
ncbi:Ribosomal large subunit pseudouridine synthase B [Aerococcus viridans]|uniref:Pseudouridine synthase n=2 Tax=Aerococcus viridans TaxID=1377 RepID=A0AAU8ULK1_9LACT|nr:pseudouridine synthase [Aerococcus viridans]AMC00757.1 pseudouridine synthase [Aerococcus viridans]EFG48981.1 pseudouridine synthase B, ribosomal large subunit [Aerococcus viridans ATCC 11563 = CCUG 4311]SUU06197.1 Ribosomal large subunit pseudouridine synthase B [Aerococcus viridans]